MNEYIFVCIGTNKIITDSFGPRVGEKLQKKLKDYPKIKIFGTMKNPVHFNNAEMLLNKLTQKEKIILVDSAIGENGNIGDTYVNIGGIQIGKAYGKSLYFPAIINIKTLVGKKNEMPKWNVNEMNYLAEKVSREIIRGIYTLLQ